MIRWFRDAWLDPEFNRKRKFLQRVSLFQRYFTLANSAISFNLWSFGITHLVKYSSTKAMSAARCTFSRLDA